MSWARFAVGMAALVLILLFVAVAGHPPEAIAHNVGIVTGAVLGGMFWPFCIWGVIRLIRGPRHAPDPRRFVLIGAYLMIGASYLAQALR